MTHLEDDAPLYECREPGCDWQNPAWRYGFAEAGAEWAAHAAKHRTKGHA